MTGSTPASWPNCYTWIISGRSITARTACACCASWRAATRPSSKNRLKATYRSWSIPCTGQDVYYTRHRAEWLSKIPEAGVRRRAERLYQQLDMLQYLRQEARRELLAESRKPLITADSILRAHPLGPGRSSDPDAASSSYQATTVGLQRTGLGNPHQRRIPLRRRATAALQKADLHSRPEQDHNHDLKGLFKGAATRASVQRGPFQDFYQRSLAKGIKPTMARLMLARKIAAITVTLWKKGENFDLRN